MTQLEEQGTSADIEDFAKELDEDEPTATTGKETWKEKMKALAKAAGHQPEEYNNPQWLHSFHKEQKQAIKELDASVRRKENLNSEQQKDKSRRRQSRQARKQQRQAGSSTAARKSKKEDVPESVIDWERTQEDFLREYFLEGQFKGMNEKEAFSQYMDEMREDDPMMYRSLETAQQRKEIEISIPKPRKIAPPLIKGRDAPDRDKIKDEVLQIAKRRKLSKVKDQGDWKRLEEFVFSKYGLLTDQEIRKRQQ